MDIQKLLHFAYQNRASDLHITSGVAPIVRINGKLKKIGNSILTTEDTEQMANELMSSDHQALFQDIGDIDFSYAIPGVCRFRVNIFKQRGSIVTVCRVINNGIPNFAELHLPPVVTAFAKQTQGLLLVTGPTGSGKSTTLASMIDYINETMNKHILTLEDPIEYLHKHKNSIINQREIGLDSRSFSVGLRAALRQDPDVILVGEMRDVETIQTALTAAETGHLVLATLHTTGAAQTVDRIIDVFSAEQQQQVRTQLASSLVGVISQRLLPVAQENGRRAAMEILVNNHAIANLIRTNKIHQIQSILETSKAVGMQTMNMSVRELVQSGIITRKTADEFTPDWDENQ
ncbi:twitching motility protein PilT [Bacillus mesophilus]|uniref:Type IV pilus twitching motility protein PilT n=1 Tax=Bacillus mesophilus TaxID=1808955 RepID=A0A6M0QD82_9BACI|nr:type IV pilus twitching motility protein PilT [Bacillus mesophilus]MBM7662322.1 twitching motility protein PilT [Bacillus mesophilus]NEY73048.1 type IV pilus twitching motility protein PilT [Bacillus mesophilus]